MTIVVLKFLKEPTKYGRQLSNLVAFLRLNPFVKIDLHRWLDSPFDHPPNHSKNQTQGGALSWGVLSLSSINALNLCKNKMEHRPETFGTLLGRY